MSPALSFQVEMWPLLAMILLPTLGAGVLLVVGQKANEGGALWAIGIMALTFFMGFACMEVWQGENWHLQGQWISLGESFSLRMGLRMDSLALSMSLLVSGIATLVLIFSRSYMRGEAHLNRYWGYLLLFCAAMLLIILADNLLLLYMAWEGVGLTSYLLIGFWYQKEKPARASQQAFLVNRMGDVGFLIGMMILLAHTGTLDLDTLWQLFSEGQIVGDTWLITDGGRTIEVNSYWMPILGISLFGGCIGKSAQFPLQIWLPDAMEGPTPVSSLIHAATMVAAGIYLMVRIFFLLDETALTYIAITGALTSLMAALAALAQWDIKRVLAYSTISQLGYMVMAVGVGATDMAMLHLFTHAFFKCALFLSAGAVIHSLHKAFDGLPTHPDAQDLRNMGGLKKHLPQTFWLYLLPMLALAGLPMTSGFLSKDGILVAAWSWAEMKGGIAWLIPISGLLTAGLTAFYMARHAWLIWGGKEVRGLKGASASIPASDLYIRIPLYVLGAGSLWLLFSLNPLSAEASWLLSNWGLASIEIGHSAHLWVPTLSIALATSGLLLGTRLFRTYKETNTSALLSTHFYQQTFYRRTFERAGLWLSSALGWWDKKVIDGLVNMVGNIAVHDYKAVPLPSLARLAQKADDGIIDGFVNGVVSTVSATGRLLRKMQSGRLQTYLLLALVGMLLLVGFWLV